MPRIYRWGEWQIIAAWQRRIARDLGLTGQVFPSLPPEIGRPVPMIEPARRATDPDHGELREEHILVVPRRVAPLDESPHGGVAPGGDILPFPGVEAVAECAHPDEWIAPERVVVGEIGRQLDA